jgi:hypothetical protein
VIALLFLRQGGSAGARGRRGYPGFLGPFGQKDLLLACMVGHAYVPVSLGLTAGVGGFFEPCGDF